MAFDWKAEKARLERFKTADYNRLLQILENVSTDREAARLLGVSPRTIYRWKTHGLGPISARKHHADIVQARAKVIRRARREQQRAYLEDQPPPVRPVISQRHGGDSVHVYMPGASLDQLFEIIKDFRKRTRPRYASFYITTRFDPKFSGWWDGDKTTQIDMGIQYRVEKSGHLGGTMNTTYIALNRSLQSLYSILLEHYDIQDGHIEKLVFQRLNQRK